MSVPGIPTTMRTTFPISNFLFQREVQTTHLRPPLSASPPPSASKMSTPSPSSSQRELLGDDKSPRFAATVPAADSGSPKKAQDAPLDPSRPQVGMVFESFSESTHFMLESERQRCYCWRIGECKKLTKGVFLCILNQRLTSDSPS